MWSKVSLPKNAKKDAINCVKLLTKWQKSLKTYWHKPTVSTDHGNSARYETQVQSCFLNKGKLRHCRLTVHQCQCCLTGWAWLTCWHPGKILRISHGTPPSRELNTRGVAEYSDFGLSNAISRKRCKIGAKFVLITNRKSHMSFRLVPNSVTLDDLEGRNSPNRRRLVVSQLWWCPV